MHYYPVFLELSTERFVVGAGAVGCRKIASLLECPIERLSSLTWLELIQIFFKCCLKINVSFTKRPFTPSDGGVRIGFCRHQQQADHDAVARACANAASFL